MELGHSCRSRLRQPLAMVTALFMHHMVQHHWPAAAPYGCRLMPGVDAPRLLAKNPSLVFSLQRGNDALGPGAEFMGSG